MHETAEWPLEFCDSSMVVRQHLMTVDVERHMTIWLKIPFTHSVLIIWEANFENFAMMGRTNRLNGQLTLPKIARENCWPYTYKSHYIKLPICTLRYVPIQLNCIHRIPQFIVEYTTYKAIETNHFHYRTIDIRHLRCWPRQYIFRLCSNGSLGELFENVWQLRRNVDLLRAVVRLVGMWHDSRQATAAKEAYTNHEHHWRTLHVGMWAPAYILLGQTDGQTAHFTVHCQLRTTTY